MVTLLSLAYVGFTQSKTYYHTLSEIATLHGPALDQRMRIGGDVRDGSIQHLPGRRGIRSRRAGKNADGELCRPRSSARHFQRRRASARRGPLDARRPLQRRASAGQVRIEV